MALQSNSAAVSIPAVAAGDRLLKITTALVVLGVAIVAAIVSYEHAYELIRTHSEDGWTRTSPTWLIIPSPSTRP